MERTLNREIQRLRRHSVSDIRNYNSAFAFASFGAKIAFPPGHGTYCLRIHGQTYHCSNTLHPNEGEDRQYGQLYIIGVIKQLVHI